MMVSLVVSLVVVRLGIALLGVLYSKEGAVFRGFSEEECLKMGSRLTFP